jgi:hypothetical protein
LALFSSSVSGFSTGLPFSSRNLAEKVAFQFSRCLAISASSGDARLDGDFLLLRRLTRRLDLPWRCFSMTEVMVSLNSSSVSGCEMVMPISAATTMRRRELRRLAKEGLVGAVSRQQGAVHGEDDEGPHERDRRDDEPVVRQVLSA